MSGGAQYTEAFTDGAVFFPAVYSQLKEGLVDAKALETISTGGGLRGDVGGTLNLSAVSWVCYVI